MLNTNEGSTHATRTPLLGASLADMLKTLTLREVEPKERFTILRDAIAYYKPRLVIIDGISDLMYNSNCIEESDSVVGELMILSTEYSCHIMNVLHTNLNSEGDSQWLVK